MAKIIKPLSDKAVREAKATGKVYRLYDGEGLMLVVMPTGSKTWVLDYVNPITGKRTSMTLGRYTRMTLKQAREQRKLALAQLDEGIDPQVFRAETLRMAKKQQANTLRRVAEQWFEVKRATVTEDHAHDIWRSLELHAFPKLGAVPIHTINAPDTIDALKSLDRTGAKEQVRRVIQRLNQVMTFAVNVGLADNNPLADIKAAFTPPVKTHMPTLPPAELPKLFESLQGTNIKTITQLLIEFQLHTMVRPSEAAKARWQDFDFNKGVWVIPAGHMKKRREHVIPLSKAVVALLRHLNFLTGHREYLFPNSRNPHTHASSQTANAAIKRSGLAGVQVAHGLRSMASTALNEAGIFRSDIIECALAHLDKNQIRAAYNRSNYLEERRDLMRWWSLFIMQAQQQANEPPQPWRIPHNNSPMGVDLTKYQPIIPPQGAHHVH
ncbi:tyrosine-type recombinase/integrase [Aliagarivorans taiwanensis]|uniref:tyrosine-type recombinase/integrase n=1 Tax=Aliagarivorans taiwanensis TaxID=561966 RepID=UPI000424B6F6|nr:tyrosine-type recombinase/integrase [Aliagarivorans taiwanensis]